MFGEKKNFAQNVAGLFVKPPEPKELVRKWQSDIRSVTRQLAEQEHSAYRGTGHYQCSQLASMFAGENSVPWSARYVTTVV